MKILLVSSEVAPFAKTGGLGDVAGSLPRALHQLGHDVRVFLPCYRAVEERGFTLRKGRKSVEVDIDGIPRKGLLRQTNLDGVPVYLMGNREYFQREGLYGTEEGDYADNGERFGFFCRAVLEMLRRLDFRPDVLHLNDWQTALIPILLGTELKNDPFFSSIGTLLTIHNLGYQGLFPREVMRALHLDPALFSVDALEYYGRVSLLKGGIVYADKLNTVSETYCREIRTPSMGLGFEGILQQRDEDLYGVLNGLDDKLWDPALDSTLATTFSSSDLRGKAGNKKALQKELGLEQKASAPIVAMVTRLDAQKGLDLVAEAWQKLMKRDLQFVLLGTGEKQSMERFAGLQERHPGKVSINLTFDDALSRRIYAGSDMFLMPSRYEPCGLGQLIALRYGSVPIVRKTGGLADTVTDPGEDALKANGFTFLEPSAPALLGAVDRALDFFGDRRAWLRLMKRGMNQDFSWTGSARKYLDIYRMIIEERNV
jgi:starch synthase